jgi:hypothetical protein
MAIICPLDEAYPRFLGSMGDFFAAIPNRAWPRVPGSAIFVRRVQGEPSLFRHKTRAEPDAATG